MIASYKKELACNSHLEKDYHELRRKYEALQRQKIEFEASIKAFRDE
jgi:hypothetical protein